MIFWVPLKIKYRLTRILFLLWILYCIVSSMIRLAKQTIGGERFV